MASWAPLGVPAIALTRRDWDFLCDQLRSTTAVLDYLSRAAAESPVPLGDEPVRYYEFAAADAEAQPAKMDTDRIGAGGTLFSAPLLPQAPAGDDGTRAHQMVRLVLEDVALSPLDGLLTEANRFTVLSDLDRLPVSARAEWGHLLLDMLHDVPEVHAEHVTWRFRRVLDQTLAQQLIVGAATRFGRDIQVAFTAFVQLRHHEVSIRTGRRQESSAIGVLLTPRHDGTRPWDTSVVRVHGDLELTEDDLRVYRETWDRTTADAAVVEDA
ncbi:hypothetical protein [Streptomyces sp. NPDC090445]|uniref:hypothetical protein n=1 Tax=Streptomyces sp. NPDC090445 TaxID=3365963 RepID=UPI00382CB8E5